MAKWQLKSLAHAAVTIATTPPTGRAHPHVDLPTDEPAFQTEETLGAAKLYLLVAHTLTEEGDYVRGEYDAATDIVQVRLLLQQEPMRESSRRLFTSGSPLNARIAVAMPWRPAFRFTARARYSYELSCESADTPRANAGCSTQWQFEDHLSCSCMTATRVVGVWKVLHSDPHIRVQADHSKDGHPLINIPADIRVKSPIARDIMFVALFFSVSLVIIALTLEWSHARTLR